jgi:hypothetical protein
MSDPILTIVGENDVITITELAPTVTVNASDTTTITNGDVTTIVESFADIVSIEEGSPTVTLTADGMPSVTISTGIGGAVDKATVLAMLIDELSTLYFTPTLRSHVDELSELWTRIGIDQSQILIASNATEMQMDWELYARQQAAIVNAAVIANTNLISGHTTDIANGVTATAAVAADLAATDIIVAAHTAALSVNDGLIAANTQAISDNTGLITANGVLISTNATAISTEVTRIDGELATLTTNLASTTATANTIEDYVIQLNDHASRINALETLTSTLDTTLGTQQDEIDTVIADQQNVEDMLYGKWGLQGVLDSNSVPYATGLVHHIEAPWLTATNYYAAGTGDPVTPADCVLFGLTVYRCILDHLSETANNPGSAAWATYWEVYAPGETTGLRFQANKLTLWTSATAPDQDLFSVAADVITLGSAIKVPWANGTGNLIVDNYYLNDLNTSISEDGSGNMVFTDANVGPKTLASLIPSGFSGDLKDSTSTKIATVVNGLITAVSFP